MRSNEFRRAACLERIRRDPSRELADRATVFTATFYAVYELHMLAGDQPELIDAETTAVLEELLKNSTLGEMRQSLFLFREAADTLCTVIAKTHPSQQAAHALGCLNRILRTTAGSAHRAVAEALGAMPFSISPPRIPPLATRPAPCIGWHELIDRTGLQPAGAPSFLGRSLVVGLEGGERVLALKIARNGDSPQDLAAEIRWMDYLRKGELAFGRRFEVPEPISIEGRPVFRLKRLPAAPASARSLHPEGYAVGYVAASDYFRYPNEPCGGRLPDMADFTEIMARNAYLLGVLAGRGVFHESPIPLFHNRVQQDRRRDGGRYEWFRAGRLDRWLDSCSYPNLGLTGLRDFEHLTIIEEGGKAVYRLVGTHLLSLLLVAGSYFRNRNRDRVGLDPSGQPVDARDLFDRLALNQLVVSVFREYYQGFAEEQLPGDPPIDLDCLTDRMIEEMGVDRHMEEIFRVADQNQLSDRQFSQFLAERGFSEAHIAGLKRGAADIVIHSGPHLGAFNDRISLPELIVAVETMSAVCVCGRHLRERSTAKAA